jgi:cyclopropane fatty-acyl-phospholipid synthase-like methyltransferase
MRFSEDRVHTPRYLLRRHLILHLLRQYKPGRFLEIGCGRGDLMLWLARCGFEGVGVEISPEALPLARQAVKPYEPKLRVVGRAEAVEGERFQYLLAFEVLEHIEDDRAALFQWQGWLEPNGKLILSVPAHMKKWTAEDEVMGHYRRYEKKGLRRLLQLCGFTIETLWSYGFPLTTLTRPIRIVLYASRLKSLQGKTREERTHYSSFASTFTPKRAARLVGILIKGGAFGFHLLQLLFRRFDIGEGYLVFCRRS